MARRARLLHPLSTFHQEPDMKSLLLFFLGVPIPLIILFALLF